MNTHFQYTLKVSETLSEYQGMRRKKKQSRTTHRNENITENVNLSLKNLFKADFGASRKI